MGKKYQHWHGLCSDTLSDMRSVADTVRQNRTFTAFDRLEYGDFGLSTAVARIGAAIRANRRIALYADYDVDGTMSAVSWIWFLQAIGYTNFTHYIPCRFAEGYGLNLKAIEHLISDEGAEVIITMDTGITANAEAALCRERNVLFICTDHHKIQPEKMPDCVIVNPKLHSDPAYQELCGCGITFVLLRRLADEFAVPRALWIDLLALTGMATICDMVPLNAVNHYLAKRGVACLMQSQRPVLTALRESAACDERLDERDIGFRLGPRINAVGRLEHAHLVVEAFVGNNPGPLIEFMGVCNERRKTIQKGIIGDARGAADASMPVVFLGGDWHPGVVGIAASRIAEEFWRPTFLFQKKDGVCKGSARSIPGFDVTEAMMACGSLFTKFGGHAAAGGFTFPEDAFAAIHAALSDYALRHAQEFPEAWVSRVSYDCRLATELATLELVDCLDELRPFGHGFSEPRFRLDVKIDDVRILRNKIDGKPRHTAVDFRDHGGRRQSIMFFDEVHQQLARGMPASFVVAASRSQYRGNPQLTLLGLDYETAN